MNIIFENIWLLGLALVAVAFVFVTMRGMRLGRYHLAIFIIRSACVLLLFMVLANPVLLSERVEPGGESKVVDIKDKTASMGIRDSIGDLPIKMAQYNITGNKTDLGTWVRAALAGGANIIVLESDGNDFGDIDLGDIATTAKSVGTVILPVIPNVNKSDVYIEGLSAQPITAVNMNYTGVIEIGSVGPDAPYKLSVMVDGNMAMERSLDGPQDVVFSYRFSTTGEHKIEIAVEADDYFKENNRYYYVVTVLEKPKILFVSNGGSLLAQQVKNLGEVDMSSTIGNLDNYDGLIIDNMPHGTVNSATEGIREFLLEGKGMLVVGGQGSFDLGNYYKTDFEGLLPVISSSDPQEKPKHVIVVFVLDVSGSTTAQFGSYSVGDVEKAILANMIRDMNEDVFFGIVAFHSDAFEIVSISKSHDRNDVINLVSRVLYSGNTNIIAGLLKAKEMLNLLGGTSYVVLLSDGQMNTGGTVRDLLTQAKIMADKGMKIYTVGVGNGTNKPLMESLANVGNGQYFEPAAYQRLDVIFTQKKEEPQLSLLEIETKNHYITKNLDMSASVVDYNKVSVKGAGLVLVSAKMTSPVLTVWHYGLGRVAALTTDDGTNWAAQVYGSALVPKTVSWIVGDIRKNKEVYLVCPETTLDQNPVAYAKTKDNSVRVEGNKIDENTYSIPMKPTGTGFISVRVADQQCLAPINYVREYRYLEANTALLSSIATTTGGRVYGQDEIGELINGIEILSRSAPKRVVTKEALAWLFLLAAFLVFFADVVIRRVREMLRGKQELTSGKEVAHAR